MKKKLLAYLLCGLVVTGTLVGAWAARADADAETSLDVLLPVSDQWITSGVPKIKIKHAGRLEAYHNSEQFIRTGQKMSERLGLPVSEEVARDGDHLLYKSAQTDTKFGIVTTMLWIGFGDGTTELIVTAQTEGIDGAAPEMRRIQRELNGKLLDLGIQPQWSVTIQGEIAGSSADSKPLFDALSRQLQAEEVERYEDRGSTSVTYYSPALRERVFNGKRDLNVQIAVHRDSVTHTKRMTIGVPAISIEY